MLDQVAALVLHVVSGDEDAIVRTGNIVRSTDAAASHDAFVEVHGVARKGMPDIPGLLVLDEAGHRTRSYVPAVRTVLSHLCMERAWAPLAGQPGISPPWIPAAA